MMDLPLQRISEFTCITFGRGFERVVEGIANFLFWQTGTDARPKQGRRCNRLRDLLSHALGPADEGAASLVETIQAVNFAGDPDANAFTDGAGAAHRVPQPQLAWHA